MPKVSNSTPAPPCSRSTMIHSARASAAQTATDASLAIPARSSTRRSVNSRSSLANQFEFRSVPLPSIELASACSKTMTVAVSATVESARRQAPQRTAPAAYPVNFAHEHPFYRWREGRRRQIPRGPHSRAVLHRSRAAVSRIRLRPNARRAAALLYPLLHAGRHGRLSEPRPADRSGRRLSSAQDPGRPGRAGAAAAVTLDGGFAPAGACAGSESVAGLLARDG